MRCKRAVTKFGLCALLMSAAITHAFAGFIAATTGAGVPPAGV